jgi:CDP-diacylglycerol--glycerol-3-phosphate 3-phosphatidyltransferase
MAHDVFKIPNLITLGRLLLLLPTAYFLSQPGPENKILALACLTLAAISDYLDGFFARRLNQQTRLGKILDPVSDKILATFLVVLLIIYRDFPFWLAGLIISRDLLILIGGLAVKSRLSAVPPSNLSGKYCFAAIAVLLISYVIDYGFGIGLFTIIAILLTILSIIMYGRTFFEVMRGKPFPHFKDKTVYRVIRITLTWAFSAIYLYKLAQFIDWL